MQVRGAGDRARSLKVKGEEIWRLVQLATDVEKYAAREDVLDRAYYLCRHRSTENNPRSAYDY